MTTPNELTPFAKEMVRQLRAIDSYGTQDNWTAEQVLETILLTKEKKKEIPIVGDPDETVVARVRAFYNAIAARLEAETGKMAFPLVHLSHEGFGRALVMVGKLVTLDKSLRDVHRFGFATIEDLEAQGEKLVQKAAGAVSQYPDAAAS